MKLTRTTRTSLKAMSIRRSQRIADLVRKEEDSAKRKAKGGRICRKRQNVSDTELKHKKKPRVRIEKPQESKKYLVLKSQTKEKIHYKVPEGSEGVEVCISFDTTLSMYPCLDEVRRTVKETIKRLLRDIPHIRIALVAHGDYGDEKTSYLIKTLDHTNDQKALVRWVNNVGRTNGQDVDECYELVLRDVQSLSWSPSCRNRSLVLIGDANPHELFPKHRNPYQIEWRKEAQKLKDMNVRIYAVHALNHSSGDFYQSLASISNGTYLKLPQFDSIVDFLCGICYGQNDLRQVEAYEKELRARRGGGGELAPEVLTLFDKLLGREVTATVAVTKGGIKPISKGFSKFWTYVQSFNSMNRDE